MNQAVLLALAISLPATAFAQAIEPAAAWREFTRTHGSGWQVVWNAATGTPRAVFGPGLRLAAPTPDIAAARAAAEGLLADQSDLLGRGSSTFVETIGVKANKTYIFVYDQQYKGLPVIGGRADVRVNEIGVVALFGSRAVAIPAGFDLRPAIQPADAVRIAEANVLGSGVEPGPAARNHGGAPRLVIWADTDAATLTRATLAFEVQIDMRPAEVRVGKAYIDAATGKMLEFKNEVLDCGCGTAHVVAPAPSAHAARMARSARLARLAAEVARDTPVPNPPVANPPVALTGKVVAWLNKDHLPTAPLSNVPLPNVLVTSSAGNAYTDASGNFSIPYAGTSAVQVTATLTGRHTKRIRVAQATQLSVSQSVTPGTPATLQFGSSGMGQFDWSQTTVYWFTNDCNEWLRGLLPAATTQMNQLSGMDPRVNIAASCNAYYTNFTINFYAESSTCAMTAYETVVQHEWGHGADHAFGGISQTDGLSEGWGDTLCIYRSRQPEVGPGFRKGTTSGIRTGNNTLTYPASGGVHTQGQTWMGFNWDLRGYLMTTHGPAAGETLANLIVISSIAADAKNQPDAVREVFIVDDNDGNLNNGTPNYNDLEKAALKRKLPYPKRVNPNAGTYTTFGVGCPGSGKSSSACQSANGSATATKNLTQNSNIFALGVAPASGQLTVAGFELFSRSTGAAPLSIATQIYLADSAGAPTGSPVRTGTMMLGTTLGWYKTTFTTPLIVPANTKFFLSYTSVANQMLFPIASSGTLVGHFWHPSGATTWNGTPPDGFKTQPWAWRVNCATGSGAIPVLVNTGVPEINTSFSLNLNSARANANAMLIFGGSDTSWGAIPLPLDMGIVGAPGCKLYASVDIVMPVTTNALGVSTSTFPIANNPSFVGVVFFNQYAIADPVNGWGIVLSNAGKAKVGKQ